MKRGPVNQWVPITTLYAEIPAAMRRQHVRPHRTLFHLLDKVKKDLASVHLDSAGVHYAVGDAIPPDPATTQSGNTPPPRPKATPPPPHPVKALKQPPVGPPVGDTPLPVDFYYHVGLDRVPPPPADFDVTPSSLAAPSGSADGTVLSLRDFVAFIPPFFVPLTAVLERMPGYTEAHVESYFSSKALEMVSVGGVRYVRLYGGFGKIELTGCEAAEESFPAYMPKHELLEAFAKVFGGIRDKWMPLTTLLHLADPTAVAALHPLSGPAAIIYFAQMQHIFSFAVSGPDGGIASVLLRQPGYGGLEADTTPTPKVLNYIWHRVPKENGTDIRAVLQGMPDAIRAQMEMYYGDVHGFFNAHAPVFYVSDDRAVVMRTSYRRRLHVASLPLEEQLQLALERRDKAKIRILRRRIAFRDDPAHPFHDPDNLAREVAKHLPRRGFIPVKVFLKQSVPEELLFYMPKRMYNFFAGYPQHFQQFEYQQAGTFCLSRPGLPLPRGVIRSAFSEDDLVALTAEYLQQRGSRACTTVFLNLPRGAQEVIRKKHGGMYYLVQKYPQYFSLVLGSDKEAVKSSAVIHLVQLPAASSFRAGTPLDGESVGEDPDVGGEEGGSEEP